MIPKVINFCWFGGKPLPKSVKKNIKTWERFCPDYKIVKWDETNFDINCNNFVRQAYKNKAWAFVSDYARLKIIYENGGIYLDTDVEIIRNLDPLLCNEAYVGIQRQENLCSTGVGFGAEKNNVVIGMMLSKYNDLCFDKNNLLAISCPFLNNDVIRFLGYKTSTKIINLGHVCVYPPKYFDPLSPGYTDDLLSPETYTIHHYDASWVHGKGKLRRIIANSLGQKNINFLKRLLWFYR